MNTAESSGEARQSSFAVGEIIHPSKLEASFRVLSVGRTGMRIQDVSTKRKDDKGNRHRLVPKEPYLVTFKGVQFKVVGFHGREFTLQITNNET